MTRIQTHTRSITPESSKDSYSWDDIREANNNDAREERFRQARDEELFRPTVDPEVMAAIRRSAERLMATPVESAEPQPRRDRSDRIPYSFTKEITRKR